MGRRHQRRTELFDDPGRDEPSGWELVKTRRSRNREIEDFEALLAQSWSLRYENPSQMVQTALLAVAHAKRLAARRHGVERVLDLQGRAFAELGNAYRVLDQLDLAEETLWHARHVLSLGSRDEGLEMRLRELEASLAASRRRFGFAADLLLTVSRFHQRTGDLHLAGRALIKHGLYTGYAGDPETALPLLREGLALVDAEREPVLVYSATHNQLLFLIDCGRFDDARTFRLRHSPILARDHGRLNRARLRWLEGRIAAGLGNPCRAEAIFREAREKFDELERPYLAAITSLDLATVLLVQGRSEETQEVVLAAYEVFHRLRIEREGIAAVLVLQRALDMGKATAQLADAVAAFLRRLMYDPTARFDPNE